MGPIAVILVTTAVECVDATRGRGLRARLKTRQRGSQPCPPTFRAESTSPHLSRGKEER
jgi:hypothetical protein